MDGASRMFAIPSEFSLGGKTYKVKGKIARFYGEMERRIMDTRPNAFEEARVAMKFFPDPVTQKTIIDSAMDKACRFVSRVDIAEWMNTVDGTVYSMFLCIRENDPEFLTLEKVTELYFDEIDKLAKQLAEEDESLEVTDAEAKAMQEVTAKAHDAINKASGSDDLGNSTGPEPTKAETLTTIAPGNTSPSPGDASSG